MLPTWTEVNEKISEFEKKADQAINQKVQSMQSKYPLLRRTIKATINNVIPFPFKEIASTIYDSSSPGSSGQNGILEIKEYFQVLQSNGEENYNKISSQLDNINNEIFNLRAVTAKEGTLQLLKDTLVSKQDTILDEIENLKSQLNQTRIQMAILVVMLSHFIKAERFRRPGSTSHSLVEDDSRIDGKISQIDEYAKHE